LVKNDETLPNFNKNKAPNKGGEQGTKGKDPQLGQKIETFN
jgi:hypothetical protein